MSPKDADKLLRQAQPVAMQKAAKYLGSVNALSPTSLKELADEGLYGVHVELRRFDESRGSIRAFASVVLESHYRNLLRHLKSQLPADYELQDGEWVDKRHRMVDVALHEDSIPAGTEKTYADWFAVLNQGEAAVRKAIAVMARRLSVKPRDKEVFALKLKGHSNVCIQEMLGLKKNQVDHCIWKIRELFIHLANEGRCIKDAQGERAADYKVPSTLTPELVERVSMASAKVVEEPISTDSTDDRPTTVANAPMCLGYHLDGDHICDGGRTRKGSIDQPCSWRDPVCKTIKRISAERDVEPGELLGDLTDDDIVSIVNGSRQNHGAKNAPQQKEKGMAPKAATVDEATDQEPAPEDVMKMKKKELTALAEEYGIDLSDAPGTKLADFRQFVVDELFEDDSDDDTDAEEDDSDDDTDAEEEDSDDTEDDSDSDDDEDDEEEDEDEEEEPEPVDKFATLRPMVSSLQASLSKSTGVAVGDSQADVEDDEMFLQDKTPIAGGGSNYISIYHKTPRGRNRAIGSIRLKPRTGNIDFQVAAPLAKLTAAAKKSKLKGLTAKEWLDGAFKSAVMGVTKEHTKALAVTVALLLKNGTILTKNEEKDIPTAPPRKGDKKKAKGGKSKKAAPAAKKGGKKGAKKSSKK